MLRAKNPGPRSIKGARERREATRGGSEAKRAKT